MHMFICRDLASRLQIRRRGPSPAGTLNFLEQGQAGPEPRALERSICNRDFDGDGDGSGNGDCSGDGSGNGSGNGDGISGNGKVVVTVVAMMTVSKTSRDFELLGDVDRPRRASALGCEPLVRASPMRGLVMWGFAEDKKGCQTCII